MNNSKTKIYKVIVEIEVEVEAYTAMQANTIARDLVSQYNHLDIVGSHIKKSIRSIKQNNALHKYFQVVADRLVEVGADYQQVIKVDAPWNRHMVKELLWRPTQKAILGKDSSTALTTEEIDKVFAPINKALNERAGIDIPFPSRDQI